MAEKITLIRMIRSAEAANGGATEADVHPDEVQHYRAAGFTVEDGKPSRKTEKES